MSYITQSDVELHFGEANIKKWSNLDNDTDTADTDRIDQAIEVAEAEINDRFRGGKYLIPFQGNSATTPVKVKDWAVKLAGCWLYFNRGLHDENDEGDKLKVVEKKVHDQIDLYVSGARNLDAAFSDSGSPSAPVVV